MKSDRARSLVALLLWHLAGLVAAVGVSSQLVIGRSIVSMGSDEILFLLTLAVAFAIAAGVNTWWLWRRAGGWHVTRVLLLTVAALVAVHCGWSSCRRHSCHAPYLWRLSR
jgi:hypothetical protein